MRSVLAGEFTDIWVSGEISGTKLPPSGHYYFTLKDESAQIRCVCYKMTARYLKFKPQDGVAVLARGRIDLYDARGEVQLVVEALEPQGHGALQFAFEQLKKKLAAEGLFEQARKRPLPALPGTDRHRHVADGRGDPRHSPDSGAPLSRASHPSLSGAGAGRWRGGTGRPRASNISADPAGRRCVIVARGGGSLEDLWTFNEERVARAIAAMRPSR